MKVMIMEDYKRDCFERSLNTFLNRGWKLYGDPVLNNNEYKQMLIKKDDGDDLLFINVHSAEAGKFVYEIYNSGKRVNCPGTIKLNPRKAYTTADVQFKLTKKLIEVLHGFNE